MAKKRTERQASIDEQMEAIATKFEQAVGLLTGVYTSRGDIPNGMDAPLWRVSRSARRRCGAKTRTGKPCKMPVVSGKRRCRLHGGASTGPKTAEGRERIAESNRRRAADRAAVRVQPGQQFH